MKPKKHRRGRGKGKVFKSDVNISSIDERNKCRIFFQNVRGLSSKTTSLNKIVNTDLPCQLVILNETALKFKNKPKIDNFKSFSRNRQNQAMGGIATLVHNSLEGKCMKIAEGSDNDEFIVTRHTNFLVPLNIVNVYGEQESRTPNREIEERWESLLLEIIKIERRNELILCLGDMNKHIGNDELGVNYNHDKVTFGGELVRGLLATGEYVCLPDLILQDQMLRKVCPVCRS